MLDRFSHRILINQSLYHDITSVEYDDDMGYVNDVNGDNINVDVKYDGDVNQHFPCCEPALGAPFLVFIDSITYLVLFMSSL